MSADSHRVARFEFTLEDYRALQTHICRPVKRQPKTLLVVVSVVFGAIGGVALVNLPSRGSFFAGFAVATAVTLAVVVFSAKRTRTLLDPSSNGSILCSYEYSLENDGLRSRTPHWDCLTRWSGIASVDETEKHLFVMIDRAAAYAIPKRGFASHADAMRFLESLKTGLAKG